MVQGGLRAQLHGAEQEVGGFSRLRPFPSTFASPVLLSSSLVSSRQHFILPLRSLDLSSRQTNDLCVAIRSSRIPKPAAGFRSLGAFLPCYGVGSSNSTVLQESGTDPSAQESEEVAGVAQLRGWQDSLPTGASFLTRAAVRPRCRLDCCRA